MSVEGDFVDCPVVVISIEVLMNSNEKPPFDDSGLTVPEAVATPSIYQVHLLVESS